MQKCPQIAYSAEEDFSDACCFTKWAKVSPSLISLQALTSLGGTTEFDVVSPCKLCEFWVLRVGTSEKLDRGFSESGNFTVRGSRVKCCDSIELVKLKGDLGLDFADSDCLISIENGRR